MGDLLLSYLNEFWGHAGIPGSYFAPRKFFSRDITSVL